MRTNIGHIAALNDTVGTLNPTERRSAGRSFVLCSSDLDHATGLHIPVDSGVAAAFLR